MKHYDPKDIRNFGLLAHGGAGKTSVAEAFLFNAKVTTRLCKVDDRNSNFDTDPEEVERRTTMKVGLGCIEWKGKKINIVDTPGDHNFFADTRSAMAAIDAAVVLVSACDGVEVGTERVWSLCKEHGLPRAILINKLDRDRANFDQALNDIKENLDPTVVPLHLPIGIEAGFRGVVDLLSFKAFEYPRDGSGTPKEIPIPADLADRAAELRTNLMEGVAESDESLLDDYLASGQLSDEQLRQGLARGVASGSVLPLLCASGSLNMGVDLLMDLVANMFPAPTDRPARKGTKPRSEDPEERAPDANAPFSAYVFKTVVDPFAGRLTIFRIYSGRVESDGTLYNATIDERERYGQIYFVQGKKQEPLGSAGVGDIVCVAKLKETKTGHTFCDPKAPITFKPIGIPRPCMSYAIKPHSQGDEDKVSTAIQRLMEEDVSLELTRDEVASEFILSGNGDLHIMATVGKMKRKFGVEVDLELPKVPYQETVKKKVTNIEGKHKKQTGGRGQFGVCYIDMEPLPRTEATAFEFEDAIFGGSIPRNFIPAVEKGIVEASVRGVLAGYPMRYFKVRLTDGKYHPVDSSEMAFKIAGSLAFKEAAAKASPTLLEPIMNMEIVAPDEHMGDIMGNLSGRRGRVVGTDHRGHNVVINAQAPMSEILTYAADLTSMTSARGTFTMSMSHYEEVPAQVQEKVVAARAKEKE